MSTETDTCLPFAFVLTTCPYEEASEEWLAFGDTARDPGGEATRRSREGDFDRLAAACLGDATSGSSDGILRMFVDDAFLDGMPSSFQANESAADAA